MKIPSGSAVLSASAHGSGSGPGSGSVLLIHAGVTDQRSWTHVVDALPNRRCLTYDARGFGDTTYEKEDGWSPVEDAVAVLDAYDAEQVVVVGSSLGGRTSIDLALLHPERVQALVLIGPAVSGRPQPTYEPELEALDEEWEAAEERGDLEAVNGFEARVWLDGPTAPEGRVQGAARDLFLEMNGRALAADDPGDEAGDAGAWDRFGEISVPTLVLVGEHDVRYIRENSARAAQTVPGARLVQLPGVAHLPHLEGDQQTLSEITTFVSSV
jgi:pimeloyl-ACP methyl ester carboxylesterase